MNLIRFFIITVLCSFSSLVFGQKDFREGYIIQNSKDTLTGFIDLQSNLDNSQKCVFKASEEGEIIVYYPKDILSYRMGDEKYYISKEVSIKGTNSLVFLECLVDGISDLFYLKLAQKEFYFLEGEDGSLLSLNNDNKTVSQRQEGYFGDQVSYSGKSNQYKGVMMATFRDSPETLEKIQTTSFTHQGLISVTKDYHENTCDWDCTLFGRKKSGLVFFEPIIGGRFSTQSLKSSEDKASNQSAILGINFRITPFRILYLWTGNIGLNYTQNSFDGTYSHRIGITRFFSNRITRLQADYQTLSLPLSLEYTLPFKGIKPFILGGVEPIYAFNIDHKVDGSNEYQLFRKGHIGAFIGTGIRQDIGSNYAKLMVQYAIQRPITQRGYLFDFQTVSDWRISLVFGFKIKGEGSEFKD